MSEETIKDIHGLRVLCIAEVRGQLSLINKLAKQHNADIVIHTGNFGFFTSDSISTISRTTLHHISIFSAEEKIRELALDADVDLKKALPENALSELPSFIKGDTEFDVPVYTVYGSSEDLSVVERFVSGEYKVKNLHLITEKLTYKVPTPNGPPLRIMGLGGSFILHRIFDNGDGSGHIAGTHGLMWTTVLQMGQLVQTVKKIFNAKEIRLFVSHACPSKEPLLYQLAITLRADFTISSSLHFFYGSSFNEFTVDANLDAFIQKLSTGRREFIKIYDAIKSQLDKMVDTESVEKLLIDTAIAMIKKMPDCTSEQGRAVALKDDYLSSVFRNMWHFNLCDVSSGVLVLKAEDGKVTMESQAIGFEFSGRLRRGANRNEKPEKQDKEKDKEREKEREKKEEKKDEKKDNDKPTAKPGLWISRCSNSEDDVKLLFDAEDRGLIQSITIKSKPIKANDHANSNGNSNSNTVANEETTNAETSSEEPSEDTTTEISNGKTEATPDNTSETVEDGKSEVTAGEDSRNEQPPVETIAESTEATENGESTESTSSEEPTQSKETVEATESTRYYALVYFSTLEEAKTALGRLDPNASRATLIDSRQSRFSRGNSHFPRFSRGGGFRRGARGGKFSGR